MDINATVSPIGKSTEVPGLSDLISKMKQTWTDFVKKVSGKISRHQIVQFMTHALDDLIVYLVEHEIAGADKKATVLNSMSILYDWVVVQAMPMWIRPFSGIIKSFVINIVISNAIDWIVSKYQAGTWSTQVSSAQVLKLWGVPEGHRPS